MLWLSPSIHLLGLSNQSTSLLNLGYKTHFLCLKEAAWSSEGWSWTIVDKACRIKNGQKCDHDALSSYTQRWWDLKHLPWNNMAFYSNKLGKCFKMAAKTVPIRLITMYKGQAVTLLQNIFKATFSDMMCRYIPWQTYCSLVT